MLRITHLFALLVFLILSCSAQHQCQHDKLMSKYPELRTVSSVRQRYDMDMARVRRLPRKLQQAQYKPIRVVFNTDFITADVQNRACYTAGDSWRRGNPSSTSVLCSSTVKENCWGTCTTNDVITTARSNEIIQTFLPDLQRTAQQLLAVLPVSGNLVVSTTNCGAIGGVPVPASAQNPGVSNADLVIFVTARPSTGTEIAFAIECQSDQVGRATAGHININPNAFFSASQTDILKKGTVLHELIHVLGFSNNKYASFRDENGQIRSSVTRSETRSFNGQSVVVNIIQTPSVVAAAQKHFNCPTANGMELEEFGGSGTAGSHWEMRLLLDEVMIGAASWSNPGDGWYISEFTLGLLQDSGWYVANFSAAQEMKYGRNYGCKMLTDRCENWGTYSTNGNLAGYFCDDLGQNLPRTCSYNHIGKGYCATATYNQDLGYYKHLSNGLIGGVNQYMDYCPYIQQYSNGDCRNPANTPAQSTIYGESYASASRCFLSTAIETNYPDVTSATSRCYETKCDNGALSVKVGNTLYPCPADGGDISLQGFKGKVTCPKSYVICGSLQSSYTGQGVLSIGTNAKGQMGVSGSPNSGAVTAVPGLQNRVTRHIAAGREFTLVATVNPFRLYAFGDNAQNQLGTASNAIISSASSVSTFDDVQISCMAAGNSHAIIVTASGTVYGMGSNQYGQLGLQSVTKTTNPTTITTVTFDGPIVSCAAGNTHSLLVSDKKTVYSFGRNHFAQLGLGTQTDSLVPVVVTALNASANIVSVAASGDFSLALSSSGVVYAFGDNSQFQLGVNFWTPFISTPRDIASGVDFARIIACPTHSLGIGKSNSKLYMWGAHAGLNNTKPTLYELGAGKTPTSLACGREFSVILVNGNEYWSWGTNVEGTQAKLTDKTAVRTPPTFVSELKDLIDTSKWTFRSNSVNATVAAGQSHVLVYLSLDATPPAPVIPVPVPVTSTPGVKGTAASHHQGLLYTLVLVVASLVFMLLM